MKKHLAMFDGVCKAPFCGKSYKHSTWIVRLSAGKFAHVECALTLEDERKTVKHERTE